jgi:hypothetical protein
VVTQPIEILSNTEIGSFRQSFVQAHGPSASPTMIRLRAD